jgi:hypothetical protein
MRREIVEEYEEFTIWADYTAGVYTNTGESNDGMRREDDHYYYEKLFMYGYSIPCSHDCEIWILRNRYPVYSKITCGFFNSQEAAEAAADAALDEVTAAIAEAKAAIKAANEAEAAKNFHVTLQPGSKSRGERYIAYRNGEHWICGRKVWKGQDLFAFRRRFHHDQGREWSELFYDGKTVATGDRAEIDRVVALIEEKFGKIKIEELK